MLTMPVAVRRMIDHGFSGGDGLFIDRYFAMLIAIGLVLALASAGRFYAVNWLGERVVADLRANVFRHLATLGPAFYETTHSGEIMSRLTADTTQIKAAAGTALSQALRNMIMLLGALTMMFVTSPMLAALAIGAIPAIVFPLLAYGRAVQRLSRAAQDRLADASAYAADNLGAARTMHAFGQEAAVSGRFAAAVERAFEAARSRLAARAGLTAIAIFLVVAGIVGVLWFGSRLVVSGEITRRPARAVRALCGVRSRRHCRAVRGVGRAGPGGGRSRAPRRAAGRDAPRSARPHGRRRSPFLRSAQSPSMTCISPIRRDLASLRSMASRSRFSVAKLLPSSGLRVPARPPSSTCCCASTIRSPVSSPSMGCRSPTSIRRR